MLSNWHLDRLKMCEKEESFFYYIITLIGHYAIILCALAIIFFSQLNYLIGPRLSGVLYTLNDDFKSSQNSANCRNSYAKAQSGSP